MPIFLVSGTVTVSAYTLVQADTEAEARKIASGREGAIAAYNPDVTESAIIEDGDGALCVTGCRLATKRERKMAEEWMDDDSDDEPAKEPE